MNRILLTGAGFSKNWGGWLVDEITNQLLSSINDAPEKAISAIYYGEMARDGSTYETILESFRQLHKSDLKNAHKLGFLMYIEEAIRKCFNEMDMLYAGKDAGLNNDANYNAEAFLAHFDVIFTTNQDRLLEGRFTNLFSPLVFRQTHKQQRSCVGLPGVVGWPTLYRTPQENRDTLYCVPDEAFNFANYDDERCLPYVKLHGSYDWQTVVGNRLMISGGSKSKQISDSPLLNSYFEYFCQSVCKPNTRIVIIGYGFNDEHLNAAIIRACRAGAKIYLIDPLGARVTQSKFVKMDSSPNALADMRTPVFTELQGALSVISQRTLVEIFGDINQAKHLFRSALNIKTH